MSKNETYVKILVSGGFAGTVMALGSLITTPGLTTWYQTLILPSYTPPGVVIGVVWTILYVLLAASMVVAWQATGKKFLKELAPLYLVNGALNIMWSVVFFRFEDISGAAITAGILAFSTIILAVANLRASTVAAALLIPYIGWALFATGLNTHIALLNKQPVITPGVVTQQVGEPAAPNTPDLTGKPEAINLTLETGVESMVDGLLSLTLERVNDSRCPAAEEVACIWAGELSPEITAQFGASRTLVRLGTVTALEAEVAGYQLSLLDAGLTSAKIKVTLP